MAVGSDIIYANTFGANRHKMAKSGYSVQELISAGIACARKACAGTDTKVALDIGPIGQLLEPLAHSHLKKPTTFSVKKSSPDRTQT